MYNISMNFFEKNPFRIPEDKKGGVEVETTEEKGVDFKEKFSNFFKKPIPGSFEDKILDRKKPEGFKLPTEEVAVGDGEEKKGKEEIKLPEVLVQDFFNDFMSNPVNIANLEKGNWGILGTDFISATKNFLDSVKNTDLKLIDDTLYKFAVKFNNLDILNNKSDTFANTFKKEVEKFLLEYPLEDRKN